MAHHQAPNPQFQITANNPIPDKTVCLLKFIWCLVFGIWIFPLVSPWDVFASPSAKSAEMTTASPSDVFEIGKPLIFDVSWMGCPVGTGTLQVKEKVRIRGRDAFHVIAIAETNHFLSHLYPVHDEIHSFIDSREFYSLEFRKTLMEGRYRADEVIRYDPDQKKGFYESLRNQTKKEITIPPKVHDLISAFFWFRLQPWAPGKSFHTVVNSEEENWDLDIDVLKRETKELRGSPVIETVQVEPRTRLKGVFYNRGRVWVNFSVGPKRLPVWIRLQTPFGPMVGVLRAKEVLTD